MCSSCMLIWVEEEQEEVEQSVKQNAKCADDLKPRREQAGDVQLWKL